MMMLAAMVLIYGVCCIGAMRRVVAIYFIAACINAALYPVLAVLDTEANPDLLFWIYGYGVSEEYLKLLFIVAISGIKYRGLIILLFLHIINHAFNEFHYGAFNDAIIICEMAYFLKGTASDFARFYQSALAGNLRNFGFSRRLP